MSRYTEKRIMITVNPENMRFWSHGIRQGWSTGPLAHCSKAQLHNTMVVLWSTGCLFKGAIACYNGGPPVHWLFVQRRNCLPQWWSTALVRWLIVQKLQLLFYPLFIPPRSFSSRLGLVLLRRIEAMNFICILDIIDTAETRARVKQAECAF